MIEVGFCGYNLTEKEKSHMRRDDGDDFLFVLLLTPFYIYSGNTVVTRPMACILFPPGAPYHYRAVDSFKNSFIHFTAGSDFLSKYNLPAGEVFYPKKPEAINHFLRNIVAEAHHKAWHFEQKIDSLVNEMFVDLSREIHNVKHSDQDFSMYSQFKKVRLQLMENCETDWTTERICQLLHMEKSQMHHYYTSFFNTTPKSDIISARVEKAKNLLANQELNVTQVAKMCGFKSASNFIRTFGKYENCPPREYAQKVRGAGNFIVLYDLRRELKSAEGELSVRHIIPGAVDGKYPPKLAVAERDGTKTLHVSQRTSVDSVPLVSIPDIPNLLPGDRITVTGRICESSQNNWAVVLRKYGGNYSVLAQQTFPAQNKLYSATYVLDKADMDTPVQIRVNPWGREDISPDFYVDSILITRDQSTAYIEADNRQVVYSLASDETVKELKPGDITEFIRASGTPLYTIKKKYGKKQIRISRRTNNWDGIDIFLPNMGLKPGNLYTISAKGRITGSTPPGASMMFQMLPGFIWRSVVSVEDNGGFSLSHTLSLMELQTTEMVRIASSPEGAGMEFTVTEIEVRSR